MTLVVRKFLYVLLSLGTFYLALLALVNLGFGIAGCCDALEPVVRILCSIFGFMGFGTGWLAIAAIPVARIRTRRFLTLGLLLGLLGLGGILVIEAEIPFGYLGVWAILPITYLFVLTCRHSSDRGSIDKGSDTITYRSSYQ